jgi:uncharacterized protein YbaP (TraB family)
MRNRIPGPIAAAVAAVVVGTLAGLAGCASAPPRCEIGPRDPQAPPLLWRVQRGDGPVVWLFGTIHDAGAGDVPPAAWAALDQAAVFVSELGDDDADPRKLGELARLPWGEVLDRMLPADDWWDLVAAMDGAGGMTADELRHARPWFALVRLRARVVRSPQPSMDFALAEHAHGKGIAVAGLETWQEQIGALATSATAADLSAAIHARHTFACQVAHLRTVYGTGDLGALTRLLVLPGRSDELLDGRNRRWLPQIEKRFEHGAFIAVGLGHLLGEAGLVAAFERAGYRVARAAALPVDQKRPASASPAESRPTTGASAARSSRSVVALRKYQVSPPASATAPIEPIAIPMLTSCMPDLAWSNTGSPGGALH